MDPVLFAPLLLILLCLIGLSWFAGSDAPYVPTKMDLIKKVLKAAGVKKGSVFYELGSGDGRVVFAAAELGARSYGVEQSWIRVWNSRRVAHLQKLEDIQFYHGNIFDRNYFPADVVYIFLLQQAVDRLEKKLKEELKPGAVVITQRYHFKKWKPEQKIEDFWIYRK